MDFPEPTRLSVFLDGIEQFLGSSIYRNYVNSLNLTGNEKVLDFGSGSGGLSKHLANALSKGGGRVTALDVSAGWLDVAKKRLRKFKNIDFVQGDILADTGLEDASFDAVVLHYVFHHVESEKQQDTLIALARILKSDGKLFIREPTKESHGTPVAKLRQLTTNAGLTDIDGYESKSFFGPMYSGIFTKQSR
jgi:ubiquinone/menaquinone biosynthesis C-methylase UbiE